MVTFVCGSRHRTVTYFSLDRWATEAIFIQTFEPSYERSDDGDSCTTWWCWLFDSFDVQAAANDQIDSNMEQFGYSMDDFQLCMGSLAAMGGILRILTIIALVAKRQ